MSEETVDYIVLGAGLAGINAAHVLAEAGKRVIIIDRSLPQANGALGGFTRFSGAKFSLLPAGQGLVPVAGSLSKLDRQIDLALSFCDLGSSGVTRSSDLRGDKPLSNEAAIRTYESIVLTPREIEHLIDTISKKIRKVACVLDAEIVDLKHTRLGWVVSDRVGPVASGRVLIAAGGRAAGSLLKLSGVSPQEGKGLDVGVRLEFLDRRAVEGLRARGPDAKVLREDTRTFCLNHPGTIFRYPFQDISIPGGIVADEAEPSANFGILSRVKGKAAALNRALESLKTFRKSDYERAPVVMGNPSFSELPMIRSAYGEPVAQRLTAFAEALGTLGLVDWSKEYRIHFPLLDWHWDVFAIGDTHRTNHPDLFVAGDAAGHARGLLQAAVSGRLAALEALDYANI
ncbi:FAD-binding protein [Agrobacterium tumefaciens]|uniref:FAD-binding protein n=1 Tax=Agrobacterium tumefaciens TaxID=358 RepID=UPI003BA10FCA